MIKHIDDTGRLVIPREIRYELEITTGDGLDIRTENKKIIITKSPFYKCPTCLMNININDNYCKDCGMKLEKRGKKENDKY